MNIPLPAWADRSAWDAFVAARKHIKKPLTEGAAMRQLKRLMKIKDAGHDPNEALLYTADHYWQDIYPAKELEIERKASSEVDRTRVMLEEMAKRGTPMPESLKRRKSAVSAGGSGT